MSSAPSLGSRMTLALLSKFRSAHMELCRAFIATIRIDLIVCQHCLKSSPGMSLGPDALSCGDKKITRKTSSSEKGGVE